MIWCQNDKFEQTPFCEKIQNIKYNLGTAKILLEYLEHFFALHRVICILYLLTGSSVKHCLCSKQSKDITVKNICLNIEINIATNFYHHIQSSQNWQIKLWSS